MNHIPVDHSEWEQELQTAALAVCDLAGFSLRPEDHRLRYWVDRLRAVAWKPDHITEFYPASSKGRPLDESGGRP